MWTADDEPIPSPRRRPEFTATSWTVVIQAGDPESPDAQRALEILCHKYWYPLYAYVRRRGYAPAQAEDLTQEFFYRLIRENYLRVVDRERGRFRSFLLTAMMHFLSNEAARCSAAKRGGGQRMISLDEEVAEARYVKDVVSDPSAVRVFEQGWAATLLGEVQTRVRNEYVSTGKTELFEALREFLKEETGARDYAAVAARVGMKPGTVAVAVHRLRQRYGQLVREAVAETLAEPSPGAVEAELQHLIAALGR